MTAAASIRIGWQAPAKYDQRNEQEFRNEMEKRDLLTLKSGSAVDRLLVIDAVTGETGLLTVQSGVVTWTAL